MDPASTSGNLKRKRDDLQRYPLRSWNTLEDATISTTSPARIAAQKESLTHSAFQYDNLDDDEFGKDYIRLIILENIPSQQASAERGARARHNLPLKCYFKKVPLALAEPFEALSYTWGNEGPKCSLLMDTKIRRDSNGLDSSAHGSREAKRCVFPIRKNLDECLRRLRTDAAGRDRVLWIDALCINQKDNKEKSVQVRKMANIYESAERVCIWLGAHENDSKKVIPFVLRVLGLNDLDDLLKDRERATKWAAFFAFLRRPWFSRRWVLQEIAVSGDKRVYCGDDWIEWKDLSDAINLFEKHNSMIVKLEKASAHRKRRGHVDESIKEIKALSANTLINTASNLFRRATNGTISERLATLERLVSILSQFDCGDGRDVIYAVLALGRDTWGTHNLTPDYGGVVTKVYEDFVEFVIKTSKSLDIICVPWAMEGSKNLSGKDHKTHMMPSWIPSYKGRAFYPGADGSEYQRANADCLVVSETGEKIYRASGSALTEDYRLEPSSKEFEEEFSKWRSTHPYEEASEFQSLLLRKSRRLFVSGIRITEIQNLERCATDGKVPLKWLEVAINAKPKPEVRVHHGRIRRQVRDVQYVPEDFWRTMVADRNPQGGAPPGVYQRICAHAFERKVGHENDDVVNLARLINETKSEDVAEFLRRMRAVTFNRRFFVTRLLSFGLAEAEAKIGDIVCILFGCSVPVILRKSEGKERYYTVVGPCYLHGVMNGEVIRREVSERFEFELS